MEIGSEYATDCIDYYEEPVDECSSCEEVECMDQSGTDYCYIQECYNVCT